MLDYGQGGNDLIFVQLGRVRVVHQDSEPQDEMRSLALDEDLDSQLVLSQESQDYDAPPDHNQNGKSRATNIKWDHDSGASGEERRGSNTEDELDAKDRKYAAVASFVTSRRCSRC